ncbi:MAG: caspase family protein [Bacteroidota bacterium]
MAQQKIYALLVGINDYPAPVPPLDGCLNDVKAMQTMLESLDWATVELEVLTNDHATKQAIADGFTQHLAKATPEDTALFYFSGHGSQEEAHEVFRYARAEEKLQSVICYDSLTKEGEELVYNFLADKELRYLIHQVSKGGGELVTIFDCCHSGDNTRSSEKARQYLAGNQLDEPFPERAWEQFLFAKALQPQDFAKQKVSELLPEGKHIQLAACLSDQRAYERDGQGLFTKHLADLVTQANTPISYADLIGGLRLRLSNDQRQTPVAYVPKGAEKLAYQPIFGQKVAIAGGGISVVQSDGEWLLNAGSIDGITEVGKSFAVQDAEGREVFTAQITSIGPTHCKLTVAETHIGKGPYRVDWRSIRAQTVPVFLRNVQDLQPVQQHLMGLADLVELVDEEAQAYASVSWEGQQLCLAKASAPKQLLVPPMPSQNQGDLNRLVTYLNHIGAWRFLLQLQNAQSVLRTQQPITFAAFEVHQDGTTTPLDIENGHIPMAFEKGSTGTYSGKFKLQLKNTSRYPLHVGMLYLNMNFMVYPNMLEGGVVLLQPGETIWMYGNDPIELELEHQVVADEWAYSTTYFKLIASMQHFDITKYEQPALPKPHEDVTRFGRFMTKPKIELDDWYTDLLTLQLKNPHL